METRLKTMAEITLDTWENILTLLALFPWFSTPGGVKKIKHEILFWLRCFTVLLEELLRLSRSVYEEVQEVSKYYLFV